MQREDGTWGTETPGGGTGSLVLEVSVAQWHCLLMAGLFSLLSDSTDTMLPITKEHWCYISGLCNQKSPYSHTHS